MRRTALVVILASLAMAGAARADGVSIDPRSAPSGAYQLETTHTQILFSITHLGITNYYGRFEKSSGTLNFNPAAPEKSSISVSIDTASANVMSGELINELIGPNVFDATHFPTATFHSTSLARTGSTTGTITGDLTIRGVTKPVTFDIMFNGGLQAPMGSGYDIGFHATATIKRSEFGLDKMIWGSFVSDDVELIVEAMFVHQKV